MLIYMQGLQSFFLTTSRSDRQRACSRRAPGSGSAEAREQLNHQAIAPPVEKDSSVEPAIPVGEPAAALAVAFGLEFGLDTGTAAWPFSSDLGTTSAMLGNDSVALESQEVEPRFEERSWPSSGSGSGWYVDR